MPRLAVVISSFLLAMPAHADTDRLLTFATLKAVEGSIGSAAQAEAIKAKTSAIGFTDTPETLSELLISPELSYSHNINGGNKDEPLIIGNIVFNGDPARYRKEGVITGLNVTQTTRLFYGHGKYFDAFISAGGAYNFEHNLGLASLSLNACSINHLSNWWFIDICGNDGVSYRELTQSHTTTRSIALSTFQETPFGSFSQLILKAQSFKTDSYTQDQLIAGINTVAASGTYTSLEFTFGAPIPTELTTEFGVTAEISTFLRNHPVSLSLKYNKSSGGMFFNQPRNELQYSISAILPITSQVTASIGYAATDSSIDYFDSAAPTFGVSFAPLNF